MRYHSLHHKRNRYSGLIFTSKRFLLILVTTLSTSCCISLFSISNKTQTNECWLREAFYRGDFDIFSHRSFVSGNNAPNVTCRDALNRLKNIGVNHLDLDLVLDEILGNSRIVVSHPMEFKKESQYYSPCSLQPLETVIEELKGVYDDNWFISLELKASWGRTQAEIKDIALAEPIKIMKKLGDILYSHNLRKTQCGIIVSVDTIKGSQETEAFKNLLDYCQLFSGKKRSDVVDDTMDVAGYHYDKVMPTIEFHPKHHGNEGRFVPKQINRHSIYWNIDTVEDLRLAADLHPAGIVSNTPQFIVETLKDPSWCQS